MQKELKWSHIVDYYARQVFRNVRNILDNVAVFNMSMVGSVAVAATAAVFFPF